MEIEKNNQFLVKKDHSEKTVIWKYQLELKQIAIKQMPKDAKVLTVQYQKENDCVFIWAMVNPEKELEKRMFQLVMTGEEMFLNAEKLSKLHYINTSQKDWLVGHLFEILGA